MENCITIPLLLLKISVYIVSVTFVIVRDIVSTKKPFDEQKKSFDMYEDWWRFKWDNSCLWVVGGLLGALLASELGAPLITKYLDWPELAESTIDLTSIAICSLIGAWLFGKIVKS